MKKAFTLIELLIVIAILGILSAFLFVSLGNSQARSRDTQRVNDLEALNSAIQMYYRTTGHFPSLPENCGTKDIATNLWGGEFSSAGSLAELTLDSRKITFDTRCINASYIRSSDSTLDLVPIQYISKLPIDPLTKKDTNEFVYYRQSADESVTPAVKECYKIISFPEKPVNNQYKDLWDPARDGGSSDKIVDGANPIAWAMYSKGCEEK